MNKPMLNKAVILLGLLCLGAALSLSSHAVTENQRKAIEERIAPVGSVCLEGDSSCGGAVVAAASGPRSAEDIYNSTCMACHSTGAGGAPKIGEPGDWKARIAQGKDTLNRHAIDGLNAMPPKGLCMNCSDEEIIAVVDFIIEKSK